MSLKLFAIGCIHGNLKKKILDFVESEKPDAVLIAGDLSGGIFADKLRKYERDLVEKFGSVADWWPLKVQIDSEKVFRKWARESAQNTERVFRELRKIKVPVFYIHGNWDSVSTGFVPMAESAEFFVDQAQGGNLHFVHNKLVDVKGFEVIGFGGYRGTSMKEYLYDDLPGLKPNMRYIAAVRNDIKNQMEKLFSRAKNKKKIILLTHDPPYKILDYLATAKKNYGEKITLDMIKKHKPLLCVCAHFHEHQGVAEIGGTKIVNTGFGSDGQCALIEIDKEVEIKLLKL